VAIKGELDPAPALAELGARGAELALPRLSADGGELRFHRAGPELPLVAGPFGLSEPDPRSPAVPLTGIDVMLVPGLAFDARGRRLGFGRGYYDRALSGAPAGARPALIGLAYEFQIVPECPADEGDVGVDLIVTDARIIRPEASE
jgi:5-formyltetrahydrofolate cyclo-ligase